MSVGGWQLDGGTCRTSRGYTSFFISIGRVTACRALGCLPRRHVHDWGRPAVRPRWPPPAHRRRVYYGTLAGLIDSLSNAVNRLWRRRTSGRRAGQHYRHAIGCV